MNSIQEDSSFWDCPLGNQFAVPIHRLAIDINNKTTNFELAKKLLDDTHEIAESAVAHRRIEADIEIVKRNYETKKALKAQEKKFNDLQLRLNEFKKQLKNLNFTEETSITKEKRAVILLTI